MLGESKTEIFEIIPQKYLPKYFTFKSSVSREEVISKMDELGLVFPVILKPDIGERGWMVKKIGSEEELDEYLINIRVNFILQEFLDFPVELGVFYYRYPNQENGVVSSIVVKEMLHVTGDGKHNIEELIQQKPRARFQLIELKKVYESEFFEKIPENGESIGLVSIGNHCLGTKFLNGNKWIDTDLTKAIDTMAKDIPDFYFGRFDLRCASIDDLKKLKNFKIMELNGAGSEPGHIYEPGFSLWAAYKVIFHHFKVLSDISRINHKFGHPYATLKEGLAKLKEIKAYNKQK